MTEKDKAAKGFLYDANYDQELIGLRLRCLKLCRAYNDCMPDETEQLRGIMRQIIPEIGEGFAVMQPFRCDYGSNIRTGRNFFANYNCIILDAAQVTFGDNVIIGAGSVVTRDIPSGVIAVGSPCRVLRKITEADKQKYPVYEG